MQHPHIFITAEQADSVFVCNKQGDNVAVTELATQAVAKLLGQQIDHAAVTYDVPNVFEEPSYEMRNVWCEIGEYNDLRVLRIATAKVGQHTVEFLMEA